MPAPLLSKQEVIERLTTAFRENGYQDASLARLSEITGLGKASLYHYFPGGKEDMARAVLAHIDQWFASNVIGALKGHGTPSQRIQSMILSVSEFYRNGKTSCLLDLFGVGEAGSLFGVRITNAVDAWQSAIADVLIEAGIDATEAQIRAEDALISIQGALIIARAKASTAPFTRTLAALPDRLLK